MLVKKPAAFALPQGVGKKRTGCDMEELFDGGGWGNSLSRSNTKSLGRDGFIFAKNRVSAGEGGIPGAGPSATVLPRGTFFDELWRGYSDVPVGVLGNRTVAPRILWR